MPLLTPGFYRWEGTVENQDTAYMASAGDQIEPKSDDLNIGWFDTLMRTYFANRTNCSNRGDNIRGLLSRLMLIAVMRMQRQMHMD